MIDGGVSERINLIEDSFAPWAQARIAYKSPNQNLRVIFGGWGLKYPKNERGVVSVDPSTCKIDWSFTTPTASTWNVCLSPKEDIVVMERDDLISDKIAHIIGIKLGSQKELWKINISSTFSNFTVDNNGFVYLFSNYSILKINPSSGDHQFFDNIIYYRKFEKQTYRISVANCGLEQMYFSDSEYIFALSKTNGKVLWKTKIDKKDFYCSQIGINNDNSQIILACNNSVYFVGTKEGKILKNLQVSDSNYCGDKAVFLKSERTVVVCRDESYLIDKNYQVKIIENISSELSLGPIFDNFDCIYDCIPIMKDYTILCSKNCV